MTSSQSQVPLLDWIRTLNVKRFSFWDVIRFPRTVRDLPDESPLLRGGDPGYLNLCFGFNIFFIAIAFGVSFRVGVRARAKVEASALSSLPLPLLCKQKLDTNMRVCC